MDPQLWSNSVWRNRYPHLWSFICPLCKEARKVPFRPNLGILQIFQIFLTSVVFSLLFWPWFHWKGIVFFIPCWMIYEGIYRWRMRGALYCSKCGFDPYLFMIDHEWAREEVDSYWRKKLSDKGIPYPEKKSPFSKSGAPSPEKSP